MVSLTRSCTQTLSRTCTRRPVFSSSLPPRNWTSSILPTLMPDTFTGAPGWMFPENR